MKGSRNSLVSLRVFVAACGHLNFSRTGEDLHMTQSAVSKHIQALELKLGASLFKRTPAGLQLTYAGAIYLENISAALRLIDEADAKVAHPSARVNLNIAVSPSFAQHCLFPHFQAFFDRHPEIRVDVRPRLMFHRDKSERFDAEIQLHTGHRTGMTCDYLCGREMCLVMAPSLLARRPIDRIEDLDQLPLLKRAQRGYGWDEWKAEMAPEWRGPPQNAPEYEGSLRGAAIAGEGRTAAAFRRGGVRPLWLLPHAAQAVAGRALPGSLHRMGRRTGRGFQRGALGPGAAWRPPRHSAPE